MRRFFKNKKGFTLIELIVVIAILGILAIIAIPRVSGFQQTARVNADHAAFATVQSVIAVAVANADIVTPTTAGTDDTITMATDANGVVVWGGTADPASGTIGAFLASRLTKPPVFQAAANQNAASAVEATWTIGTDGMISLALTAGNDLQ